MAEAQGASNRPTAAVREMENFIVQVQEQDAWLHLDRVHGEDVFVLEEVQGTVH